MIYSLNKLLILSLHVGRRNLVMQNIQISRRVLNRIRKRFLDSYHAHILALDSIHQCENSADFVLDIDADGVHPAGLEEHGVVQHRQICVDKLFQK